MMHPGRLHGHMRKKLRCVKVGLTYLKTTCLESGASDTDYYAKALIDYEAEIGTMFKLRHCWEILKDSPKWMQSDLPISFARSWGGNIRYKSSGSSSFNTESEEASINLNANVGDDKEDVVQGIRRPMRRDKAEDAAKKKGSRASGSSSANDEALARLMASSSVIPAMLALSNVFRLRHHVTPPCARLGLFFRYTLFVGGRGLGSSLNSIFVVVLVVVVVVVFFVVGRIVVHFVEDVKIVVEENIARMRLLKRNESNDAGFDEDDVGFDEDDAIGLHVVETALQFLVTTSKYSGDDVRTYIDDVKVADSEKPKEDSKG
ncbi:RNA-directed DNA polymerase, eukaryota [Tanacetum coccineum]